jgi:hypothetical protein
MRITTYGLKLVCGFGITAVCIGARAQQVSPVISEFNKKARGVVQIVNTSDAPKFVSCRAQGFDPDEHGGPRPHPPEAALNVRIASERVLLGPHGSRQVSFDAAPAVPPAWFLVTCLFTPVQHKLGLTVAMEISSIVIVHAGQLDTRDVLLSAKLVGAKVEIEVKNNGSGLARVDSGEVVGHRKEADLNSFILYPHQLRTMESDWKESSPPETVRIQIGKKRLEAPIN